MLLRVRITGKTISPDGTLAVVYQIALADAQGKEVWSEEHRMTYRGPVERERVLSDLYQAAEARAGVISAWMALDADIGLTYERQPNGTWVQKGVEQSRD